jgi:hypothetical protein
MFRQSDGPCGYNACSALNMFQFVSVKLEAIVIYDISVIEQRANT